MHQYLWRLRKKFGKYFYDERYAGRLRFLFFISLSFVFVLLGYYLFEDVNTTALEDQYRARYLDNPFFNYPFYHRLMVVLVQGAQFVLHAFRHAIIPFCMFVGVLIASAFYVQDVYELPTLSLAVRYIWASFAGQGFPKLKIEDGEKQIKPGETNLIDTIGGPGFVNVHPGNLVLFESLRSPSSVLSGTKHFISRFETIKEIVSLDDQHGFIEEAKATTRDGIQVIVRDVHYRYRLRTGRRYGDYEQRKALEPYEYSIQAVKNMAYNRSVRVTGLSDWHATVQQAVDGAITDYIKSHKFDQLTAPGYEDADPRDEISNNMKGGGTRGRLRNIGAELLWFDIGHFDIVAVVDERIEMKRTITEQRIDTWSARLDGDAMVIQAAGEGRRMSYQEVGRAEGQAELLNNIIRALEDNDLDDETDERQRFRRLRSILWMRVAQVLDRIAEEEQKQQKQQPPDALPPIIGDD